MAAIPGLEAALLPASPKAALVAIARLVNWAVDMGLASVPVEPAAREAWTTRMVGIYRDALRHLPADLLLRAIDGTMRTHRYRNMPLAGDIAGAVRAELMQRQNDLAGLRLALKLNRFAHPPVRPEDRPTAGQFGVLRSDLAARSIAATLAMADVDPPTNADTSLRTSRIHGVDTSQVT